MKLSFEVREDLKSQRIFLDVRMSPKSGGRENVVPTPMSLEQADKLSKDLEIAVKALRDELSIRS